LVEIPAKTRDIPDVSLPKIGTIRIKTPKDFSKSPFGIGCETLDRDLWNPKEIYPWMDNLPVKWARLQTGWARVEKEKGAYDWGWLDESVDGLIKRGFKPFFNVGYGNPNYTEGDTGYFPMVNEEAYIAWKKFIKALAMRYKDRISHFEIWNEPNLKGFWKPGEIDPEKYVKLVKDTAPIIRKNCPGAVIIGGVVSRLPFTFVRDLFKYGLGKEIDIFSFHPYGVLPESYVDRIKALRKFIDLYNPAIKIWQGENGYPSEPNSTGFVGELPWTEAIQAKIMLRRLLTDCSLGIDMTLWFLIVDIHDYPKGSGKVNYKGILRVKPRIEPKLAFSALQNLGSTVYGDVRVRTAILHCTESNKMTAEEAYKLFGADAGQTMNNVYSTMLNTDGGKILAYWETKKAMDNCEAKNIDLLLWDWEGNGFEEPVLLDLLSGGIYALGTNFTRLNDNDRWRISQDAQIFQQLPLRDYPMLIVEKKMVIV
jgi:hypothetical protein